MGTLWYQHIAAILSTAPHITPPHSSSYPILLVPHPLYQTAANWTPVAKAARARTRAFRFFSSQILLKETLNHQDE